MAVAADPSFATPLIDVTTDSKSYTSETTPPADEILYWRVRANDVNGAGLNWSATESFSHTVPGPAPAPGNPIGGETLPVFSWTPENGAVPGKSYTSPIRTCPPPLKYGAGWPLGPCELLDLIGIDIHVHASEALHAALGEPRMAPPERLVEMVRAGRLGKKTGCGFFEYD